MSWHLTATQPLGFGFGEGLTYLATDGAGQWVAGGNRQNVWVTNDDGNTWTGPINVDPVDLAGLSGVQWLNDRFVAWGPSSTTGSNIYTSPDGSTWTQRASQIDIALSGTENEGGGLGSAYLSDLYIIVGQDTGAGFTSVTSPDGVTWTLQNVYSSPSGGGFTGVISDGTHFVATVIDNSLSPVNQVAYSTDGANWTFQSFTGASGFGPNGFPLGIYFFDSKYIVGWGYDSTANGGLGQGWYEVATTLSPWNGVSTNVTSSPLGVQVYPFTADNGSIALGAALNFNDLVNTPEAITTTNGTAFLFEAAGFAGGEFAAVARGTDGFMAVGSNSSNVNIAAFRPDVTDVTVPNVVGLPQTAAENQITSALLAVGSISSVFSNTVPAGNVVSQSPIGGMMVAEGSPVNLTISEGPQLVIVPDVINDPVALAAQILGAAGLNVGGPVAVIDFSVPFGCISGQNPLPGTSVLIGSTVNLSVSSEVLPFNANATVISQYSNSNTLLQLIENMSTYIDPRENILNFFNLVWNVDTAVGFGLDIWGRIVGVNRVIPIPGTSGAFGFDNSDTPPDWENFGVNGQPGIGGPFFSGELNTGSFTLNDPSFRTLILTKALANICQTTAPALNQLITNLFPGRGKCYTTDGGKSNSSAGGMSMTYVFKFSLTTIEHAILAFSGVLPHPAGVLTNVLVVPEATFGFAEQGPAVQPFNFGVFQA